jgi:hypothetical protein
MRERNTTLSHQLTTIIGEVVRQANRCVVECRFAGQQCSLFKIDQLAGALRSNQSVLPTPLGGPRSISPVRHTRYRRGAAEPQGSTAWGISSTRRMNDGQVGSMMPKIPRGKIIGKQIGGPPLSEVEHFFGMRSLRRLLRHARSRRYVGT